MSEPFSRRRFIGTSFGLSVAGLAAGGMGLSLAGTSGNVRAQGLPSVPAAMSDPDAVLLNFNEHPLGPFPEAIQAAIEATPRAGRYLFQAQRDLARLFASQHALESNQIDLLAGSGVGLDQAALAFTSPTASLVMANPTFESVAQVAEQHGARVHRITLRTDGAHDVQAMAAADPEAGLVYLCNPNNPTGSITPRAEIDWLLANKPAGSVLLIDEAYIHYSDEPDTLDLVRAGADVIVLRTFSKIYGMAGMRLGFAIARPDLITRLMSFGSNSLPVPTAAAGAASLQQPGSVTERKQQNRRLLDETLAWLDERGFHCLPSQANCFMVDTGRPGREFVQAMAEHKVFVGRSWPIWPQHVRVTVGTEQEMQRFREAFEKVMKA